MVLACESSLTGRVVIQHQLLLYCMWLSTRKYDGASAHNGASGNQCSASGLEQVLLYTRLANERPKGSDSIYHGTAAVSTAGNWP